MNVQKSKSDRKTLHFSKLPYELCSGILDTFYYASPVDQLILYTRIFHGTKYREIADEIDLSLQAVGVRYKTMLNTVRVKFEDITGLSGHYTISINGDE